MIKLPSFRWPARKGLRKPASARLLPALMATIAAILGLKAVAVAEAVSETAAAPASTAAPASSTTPQAPAAVCAAPSFADQAGLSQAEVQVLQALGARRQALDARATDIDTSTELMSAAEQRLNQRLTELHQLEASVNTLLGQLDQQQAARMANLVDVYQRMSAKNAAAVFDTLDDDTMLLVASRMRQQNLAEVMGRMTPARARRLTQMLAELSRQTQDGRALLASASGGPAAPASAPQRPAAPATPPAAR